jgi:hypothetical protein
MTPKQRCRCARPSPAGRARQQLDENGVNPATGKQVGYVTELSIGPDGPGGLHLIRGRGHSSDESSDIYVMKGNPATQVTIAAGMRTITFNKVSGVYVPTDGSGAKLVQNSSTQWTLTLDDGTVVVYTRQHVDDSYPARGTSVTFPTGGIRRARPPEMEGPSRQRAGRDLHLR